MKSTSTSALLFLCIAASLVLAKPAMQSKTISAGSCVLWIDEAGNVWSSGDAESTRGDDVGEPRNHFEQIADLKNVRYVATKFDRQGAAALDEQGRVWTWGFDHDLETHPEYKPLLRDQLENVVDVALGSYHLAALTADGKVQTLATGYASNEFGQLGSGTLAETQNVVTIANTDDVVDVDASDENTFMVKADGTVWGVGNGWMLGHNGGAPIRPEWDTEPRRYAKPIQIVELGNNIKTISTGVRFGIALDRTGQVWGWGFNDSGQFGLPADDLTIVRPKPLAGLNNIVAISAGGDFVLALRNDGRVVAQGGNVYGALGDRSGELEGAQRVIAGLQNVTSIHAGEYNAFAILKDGTVMGWGANDPTVGGFHATSEHRGLLPIALDRTLRPAAASELVQQGAAVFRCSTEWNTSIVRKDFEIVVNDKPIAKLTTNPNQQDDQVRMEIPLGVHRYSIRGTATDEDGRTLPVTGRGVIYVGEKTPSELFADNVQQHGLVSAIQTFQTQIENVDAAMIPSAIRLHAEKPWDEATLARFETKLDRRLPAGYRAALTSFGPFRLGDQNTAYPTLALFAPDEKRSLERWVADSLKRYDAAERDVANIPNEAEGDAVSNFGMIEETLRSPAFQPHRRRWQSMMIGAIAGVDPFLISLDGKTCVDGTSASLWPDFFDVDMDDQTGAETHLPWLDESKCDFALVQVLVERASDTLNFWYAEHGVAFATSATRGSETFGIARITNEYDDNVPQWRVQLATDGWSP